MGATMIFAGLGLLLAPGLAHFRSDPQQAEPSPETPVSYEYSRAVSDPDRRASASIEQSRPRPHDSHAFDCMIQPNEVVDVGSAVTGRIDSILAERGDYVTAGQVLAELESSVERVAVEVARANALRRGEIESSEANVALNEKRKQRALELFERNSVSLEVRETVETEATFATAELKRARENHELANLQLHQAEANLARRSIQSPVAGFVIDRLMAPGEVVDEDTILRVAQVDPLRVEVILPTDLYGRVRPGDRARIVPEAPLDEPRTAEIAIVDPIIDGASATFGAVLLLPNPQHDLPAGLRCEVTFLPGDDAGPPRAELSRTH